MISFLLLNVIFAMLGLFLNIISEDLQGKIVGIIIICVMLGLHIFEFILFTISNYKKEKNDEKEN